MRNQSYVCSENHGKETNQSINLYDIWVLGYKDNPPFPRARWFRTLDLESESLVVNSSFTTYEALNWVKLL